MRKPENPKLYAMFVAQARAKYSSYPNPGASAWVAKKYQQAGGRYIETTEADRRRKMAQKKLEHQKQKESSTKKSDKDNKKETKKKTKGNK